MNTTLHETLLKTGMEPTTAEIYLTLVENGEMTVPRLLENIPLSRATVYEALPTLLAEGFVEYRKEGRVAYYKPTHPNKLFTLMEEKKREVSLLEGEFKNMVSALTGMFQVSNNKPGIRFFEGKDGLQQIYDDTLTEVAPIYALLSPAAADVELADWLNTVYVKKRVEKNIHASVIAPESEATKVYSGIDKDFLRETLVIPAAQFPVHIEIDIYGKNKVAFISYKKDELFGVILESPAIYLSMKTFFQLAWSEAGNLKQQVKALHLPPAS